MHPYLAQFADGTTEVIPAASLHKAFCLAERTARIRKTKIKGVTP
jgi:hypothetical protein